MPQVGQHARIAPLEPPYPPDTEAALRKWMPPASTAEPLKLFRTLNIHQDLASRMRPLGAGILAHGRVEPREREIVIHRTCARAGAEYEWGVHVLAYGKPLGLSDEQIAATVHGPADDPVWSEREALLIRLADELHENCTIASPLWTELTTALRGRSAARADRHRGLVQAALRRHQRRRSRTGALGRALPGTLRSRLGLHSCQVSVGRPKSSRPVSSQLAAETIMCWVATWTSRTVAAAGSSHRSTRRHRRGTWR